MVYIYIYIYIYCSDIFSCAQREDAKIPRPVSKQSAPDLPRMRNGGDGGCNGFEEPGVTVEFAPPSVPAADVAVPKERYGCRICLEGPGQDAKTALAYCSSVCRDRSNPDYKERK